MIHADIEDYGKRGIEVQKGILVFAGFENEFLSFLPDAAGSIPELNRFRAAHDRRISARKKDMGKERRCGAFAVHPRHAHAVRKAHHEVAEVIRAGNQRQSPPLRLQILRIVLCDGNGINHRVATVEMRRVMLGKDPRPRLPQPVKTRAFRAIRAAHLHALRKGQERQRVHTHPADPDKKQPAATGKQQFQLLRSQMRIVQRHITSPFPGMHRFIPEYAPIRAFSTRIVKPACRAADGYSQKNPRSIE